VVVVAGWGMSYWAALFMAAAVGMVLGMLLESTVIRRLIGRPLDAILVTLGLGLVIQELLRAHFGSTPRTVPAPLTGTVRVLDVNYPSFRLLVIVVVGVVIAATAWTFARTSFGLVIRAIFQSREAAVTNGVRAATFYMLAFGIGTALAAFAGALLAPTTAVLPQMGSLYLGSAFIAVILGGSSRLLGALAGAAFIGGLEVVIGETYSWTWSRVLVLVLAVLLIRFRPTGLLPGVKERVA
jgi:branched-chain amino acid transport system permease protein/urea transport system permease protein